MTSPFDHVDLLFITTDEAPCPYLEGQKARYQVISPQHHISPMIYQHLTNQGFRRSEQFFYRPNCATCQACFPYRILTSSICYSRTQKRCATKYAHLSVKIRQLPIQFNPEHYELYHRYVCSRHPQGEMARFDALQFQQHFLNPSENAYWVEFYDHDQLVMVSLIDRLAQGLSATYTFFNPKKSYSGLGVYGILWQIQWARQLDLPFVYLGYWIKISQNMSYKSKFRPAQVLVHNHWQLFEDH